MSLINVLFLPILFFIGLVTSYEDIRYGKIRNKWIILGIAWGLGILFLFFIGNLITNQIAGFFNWQAKDLLTSIFAINYSFLLNSFINFFIAIIVGFFMWRFNVWAAGDAKLFIVYSLLVPITYYWKSFLPFFPAITLLINIFVIIILYLFIYSFFLFFRSAYQKIISGEFGDIEINIFNKIRSERTIKMIKNMSKFMAGILLIILFLVLGRGWIQSVIPFNIVFLQAIIFTSIIVFSKYIGVFFKNQIVFKAVIVLLVLLCALGVVLNFNFTLGVIYRVSTSMIIFMILFFLLQRLLDIYINKVEYKEIKIEDLGPKMILTPQMHKKFNLGSVKDFIRGLTPEQVNLARQRAKDMNLKTVYIQKPFPFAIWIFIGVLVTLLFKGSLISLVLNFVS